MRFESMTVQEDTMNKVICGDSLSLKWDSILGGRKIDMLMIDPPYNTTNLEFDGGFDIASLMKVLDPHLSQTAWIFCWGLLDTAAALLSTYRHKFEYVWYKHTTYSRPSVIRPLQAHEICWAFIRRDLERVSDLYFDRITLRTAGVPYRRHTPGKTSEFIAAHNKPLDTHIENWGYRTGKTVLRGPVKSKMRKDEFTLHPTQKPLAIYEPILRAYCPPNGLIVDPCAGSGTTHIAGINTKRNTICVEKEEKYCSIIRERKVPTPQPIITKPDMLTLDVFAI